MRHRATVTVLCACALLIAACSDDAPQDELRRATSPALDKAADVNRMIEDQAAAQRRAIDAQSE